MQAPARRRATIGGRRITVIDIHAHTFVPEVWDLVENTPLAAQAKNNLGSAGAGIPATIALNAAGQTARLQYMDKEGIDISVLNMNPWWYAADRDLARRVCDLQNEKTAEWVKRYPDRFVGMATCALQHPDLAAEQLEYGVRKLNFRGAPIGGSVEGQELSDRKFDPFWAKAEELDALVFMHPDNPAGTDLMGSFGLRLVCGNPADTTLSLGLLIYSGVFDRFPNLKLCTCHGGGFFPYHVSRFDREFVTGQQAIRRAGRPNMPKCASAPSAYLKNLYFDTLVYDVETLDFLRGKVGADHLLLGTDFPYILGDWQCVEKVQALNCPATEKHAILAGNARKLLKISARRMGDSRSRAGRTRSFHTRGAVSEIAPPRFREIHGSMEKPQDRVLSGIGTKYLRRQKGEGHDAAKENVRNFVGCPIDHCWRSSCWGAGGCKKALGGLRRIDIYALERLAR